MTTISPCVVLLLIAKITRLALLQAVVEQVQRDHALLRTRILRLGGRRAIARLEAGLAAARAAAEADQQENTSASGR